MLKRGEEICEGRPGVSGDQGRLFPVRDCGRRVPEAANLLGQGAIVPRRDAKPGRRGDWFEEHDPEGVAFEYEILE